jgi:hypothetical protein
MVKHSREREGTYQRLDTTENTKGEKDRRPVCLPGEKEHNYNSEGGMSVLKVTNEYGNSVRYEISDSHRFDSLLANLWQFVKDSQH